VDLEMTLSAPDLSRRVARYGVGYAPPVDCGVFPDDL
jgi:hypothetical protein